MLAASPHAPEPDRQSRLDRVLGLVLGAKTRPPANHLPKRLNGLFRELGKAEPANDPDDIEDLIWALWISHPEGRAATAMANACEAMAMGAFDLAKPIQLRRSKMPNESARVFDELHYLLSGCGHFKILPG